MIAQLDKDYIRIKPHKVYSRLLSYFFFEGRPLTTPGQWINPIVFANYHILSRLPQSKTVEKPVFILGTGRSGSTILGKLLSMHAQVGFLNEPKALWNFVYPYEDLIGSYSRGKANYFINEKEATPDLIKKAHNIYSWFLTLSGTRRIVDKYPELIFRYDFVKKIFPDAKFIFLVRNGWDCCVSVDTWSERKGVETKGEVHDWWGADGRKWDLLIEQVANQDTYFRDNLSEIKKLNNQSDMAALEWLLTMKQGLKLIDEEKDVFLLKYEDLINDSKETLSKLINYCELLPDEKQQAYADLVLKRRPTKEKPVLSPLIKEAFLSVQEQLGYPL